MRARSLTFKDCQATLARTKDMAAPLLDRIGIHRNAEFLEVYLVAFFREDMGATLEVSEFAQLVVRFFEAETLTKGTWDNYCVMLENMCIARFPGYVQEIQASTPAAAAKAVCDQPKVLQCVRMVLCRSGRDVVSNTNARMTLSAFMVAGFPDGKDPETVGKATRLRDVIQAHAGARFPPAFAHFHNAYSRVYRKTAFQHSLAYLYAEVVPRSVEYSADDIEKRRTIAFQIAHLERALEDLA